MVLVRFPLCARILRNEYRFRRYVTAQRYYIAHPRRWIFFSVSLSATIPQTHRDNYRYFYVISVVSFYSSPFYYYYRILPRSDTCAILSFPLFFLYHCRLAPATNSTCNQIEREANVFISRAGSIKIIESYL